MNEHNISPFPLRLLTVAIHGMLIDKLFKNLFIALKENTTDEKVKYNTQFKAVLISLSKHMYLSNYLDNQGIMQLVLIVLYLN